MSGSKSKKTQKPADKLTKPGKTSVELSESALDKTSGGAVFPSGPSSYLKIEQTNNPGALVPAVQLKL
ncbi:MAG TPA: hypothetical protein VMT54_04810 [Candidatus Cybelea sp.]|nr:hypothetical protein [Candidatus Cybelea sp.]